MQYLKNALFVAMFMLLGFGLEAAVPTHTFSTQSITADAPQNGIINVIQGRQALRVEIFVPDRIRLVVRNDAGEVVFRRSVRPDLRNVRVRTSDFADGTYTRRRLSG